jgi:hypothetical protein
MQGRNHVNVYRLILLAIVLNASAALVSLTAHCEEANYDEAKAGPYTLPDPLIAADGTQIKTKEAWVTKRRPEILHLFQTEMFGISPARPKILRIQFDESATDALDGKAVKKVVRVNVTENADGPEMLITLYLPANARKPVPVFVGVHLFDTAAPRPMPGKPLAKQEVEFPKGLTDTLPGDRLPETILERGYGFATINAADIAPDNKDTFDSVAIRAFLKPGKEKRGPNDWGAIGVWAWGLSRALDFFECDPEIDAKRVIAIGHSRMGKTALWAGAQDERFAMIISNNSGCGGAALSKRIFGETVGIINDNFPHWFSETFRKYNQNESALPFDQHELIALIAPRPVYIASSEMDRWADPTGEFLSGVNAAAVYALFGKTGLGTDTMPEANKPIGEMIGYHNRSGKHALTDYDWVQYLNFADMNLKVK